MSKVISFWRKQSFDSYLTAPDKSKRLPIPIPGERSEKTGTERDQDCMGSGTRIWHFSRLNIEKEHRPYVAPAHASAASGPTLHKHVSCTNACEEWWNHYHRKCLHARKPTVIRQSSAVAILRPWPKNPHLCPRNIAIINLFKVVKCGCLCQVIYP